MGGVAEPVVWPKLRRFEWLRVEDLAWFLFLIALVAFTPETNYDLPILLVLLGLFQVAEPRLSVFSSKRGQVASIALKLVFCYLLIGYTHGIASPYQPILFIPVISAATTFELGGVITVTLLAALSYASFLLPIYIDWSTYELPPDFLDLMGLRISFFALVAFLVYKQAKLKRTQIERTEEAAAQLAESNRSLQKAEASLRRTERLAALGQLTAGLAHELRNPLGTIRASAEMLGKQAARGKPEVLTEMSEYIRSEVDRMNGLITSFLHFARPLQTHPTSGDFRALVEQVFREQQPLAESCRVHLQFEGGGERFTFDPDLLRLAISNLVQNAIQSSEEGATVIVRLSGYLERVTIEVVDRGKGIDPEHLESIFNPFFTTKPEGVGLGLAIVSKIVDEHNGTIAVQSNKEGTRFSIVLPREQST